MNDMRKKFTPIVVNTDFAENEAKVLVDGRGVLHCALHWAIKNYEGMDVSKALVFCFFQKLKYAARTFHTNRLVFCWESEKLYRTEIYPEYKATRADTHELVDPYMPLFMEMQTAIIPALGFANSLSITGLEADDIIAVLTRQENRLPLAIFSEDGDLYQLIKQNVFQMSVKRATEDTRPSVMSKARFIDIFGLPPGKWGDVKAIGGCRSDGVKGIKGVGEATAIKYLLGQLKGLKHYLIEQNQELIKFNEKLVKLPYEKAPERIELRPDKLNAAAFVEMVKKYDLYSMLESGFWQKFFGEGK